MATGATTALTIWTFVGRITSLLFSTLSQFLIACWPRIKCLLISRLQSPSTVILEPKERKSVTPVQCSSVTKSCPTLQPNRPQHARPPCPWPTPGVYSNIMSIDAIQPSHPLLSPSPPAFNLSQYQSLFKWLTHSSHQEAKLLEFQLQHQSFQQVFRVDFLV